MDDFLSICHAQRSTFLYAAAAATSGATKATPHLIVGEGFTISRQSARLGERRSLASGHGEETTEEIPATRKVSGESIGATSTMGRYYYGILGSIGLRAVLP